MKYARLITLGIGILTFAMPLLAFAQSAPVIGTCVNGSCPINQAAADQLDPLSAQSQSSFADQTAADTNAAAANNASYTSDASSQAAANKPADVSFLNDPLDYLMAKLMTLFAWLLGIAAITLDNAMYYTVVHMGTYINGLSAVGVAWRILRDLGNIILIFGFIALGITVILDVDWYGGGTKMLPVLLIAAVFLNFSLFIAEAVIDTGNLFATEFYTQIKGGTAAAPTSYANVSNEGISRAVMNQLGLQTIYNTAVTSSNGTSASGQTSDLGVFKQGNPFIIGFMAILLFMVAAFVFFSLAFILIARFIFLIFLIIIAPIGFAGLAVPKLEGYAKQWWGALFEQTLTAPVMLLMLYVALAVITDSKFLTGFNVAGSGTGASDQAALSWLAWINGGANGLSGLASALLSFLVAMGLLLAVTMLAKKMGAAGGTWATNMGGKLSFGVVGFATRNTVGRTSNYVGRTIRNSKLGQTEYGRYLAKPFDIGAKASFDGRATGALKAVGAYDGGKAQKGGYLQEVEDQKKVQLSYGKSLSGKEEGAYTKAKEKMDEAAEFQKKLDIELKTLEAMQGADRDQQKIDAKKAEKKIGDEAYTAAKAIYNKTPKNAQVRYGKSLQGNLGTASAVATGAVASTATASAVGATIGTVAGPIGTIAGGAIGAAFGAEMARRQARGASASKQVGEAIDKSAGLSKAQGAAATIAEALAEAEKKAAEGGEKH